MKILNEWEIAVVSGGTYASGEAEGEVIGASLGAAIKDFLTIRAIWSLL